MRYWKIFYRSINNRFAWKNPPNKTPDRGIIGVARKFLHNREIWKFWFCYKKLRLYGKDTSRYQISKTGRMHRWTWKNPFKWRHFVKEIILLNVRWYLRYSISYRDLEEMMLERGLKVDNTTIYRWVQSYSPEIEKRCKPHLRTTNDSYRVDETYI